MTVINPSRPNNLDAPLKIIGLANEIKASWDEDLVMFGPFDLSRSLTPVEDAIYHDFAAFHDYFEFDDYEVTVSTQEGFQVDTMGTVVAQVNDRLRRLEGRAKEVEDRIANTVTAATATATQVAFD